MKITPKKSMVIFACFLLPALVAGLIGLISENENSTAYTIGGTLCVIGIVIHFITYRCPYCRKYLGRNPPTCHCPNCGKKVDE